MKKITSLLFILIISYSFAQQDVFSRDVVTTGNWGDGQLPWFYPIGGDQGDPDNGGTIRNFVKIGHNNNTTMTTNGRFYIVNTLDFQSGASANRTINNAGGGISVSGGIYNASIGTHTINTPVGIDGTTVQLHANASGGLNFNETIFINTNTVEFGNSGSGEIIVNGVMEGTGNVAKVGSNLLTFTNNNIHTGSTTISGGTLKLQGDIADSDVTVQNGATLEIDGDVTLKSLTVESGGAVEINPGKSLLITGNLANNGYITMESTSSTYSSLIPTTVSGSGTYEYQRYTAQVGSTGTNDLVSVPVLPAGSLFTNFAANNSSTLAQDDFFPEDKAYGHFDKINEIYRIYDATDIDIKLFAGLGYRAGTVSGGNLKYIGTVIATGDISLNNDPSPYDDFGIDTDPGNTSYDIWNLIGNPYTSYIKVADFLSQNLAKFESNSASIYGYNGTGWTQYNLANAPDPDDRLIAPGQGFFISSNGTGTTDPLFTPAMRSIGTSGNYDDFISLRTVQTSFGHVKLKSESASNDYSTDVYFNSNATRGLDPGYDASLFGGSAPEFSIYSHLVEENTGIPMGIQALGATDFSDVTIPLGIHVTQGEQVTVSMLENTVPANINVYLEDNVANTFTLLNSSDYIFTPASTLNSTGRFFLRFSDSALSTDDSVFNGISIYGLTNEKLIKVDGFLNHDTQLFVYDIQGRVVLSNALDLNTNSQHIDASSLSTGIYVVELQNSSQTLTKKVIMR